MDKSPLPLILLPSATSTMDVMKQRSALGLPPAAVCCLEQTSGRGRYGNKWISAVGDSLMLSVPADGDSSLMHKLPFASALAVGDFIHNMCGLRCGFLWPNDVIVGHRKLAGILIEQIARGSYCIGIGVNLQQTEWPLGLNQRAVSLSQLGYRMPYDIIIAVHAMSSALLQRILWARRISLSQVIESWSSFSCTSGVQYTLPGGEMVAATGVDHHGHLLIQRSGRLEAISSAVPLHKSWVTIQNIDQETGDSYDR